MIKPQHLKRLYTNMENYLRRSGVIAGKSDRHMKFPYTVSAKIAQFPMFYYMKNNFIWMYWPVGWLVTMMVFVKIHSLANSEENKRSWAEQQRKSAEKEHGDH